jgi:hypothetical protein
MSSDPAAQLRDGMAHAAWQVFDLWLAGVALGASLDMGEVANIVAGGRAPTAGEYQVLAAAINEHLVGLDGPPTVLWWGDLADRDSDAGAFRRPDGGHRFG